MNIQSSPVNFCSSKLATSQQRALNNNNKLSLNTLQQDTVTFSGFGTIDDVCSFINIKPENKGDTLNINKNMEVDSIKNEWGRTYIKGCNVKARQIENEQGMLTIHNAQVKADIDNMWGVINIGNDEGSKTSIIGNITNQYGPINIKGASKDSLVEVKGNLENTHRDINVKNAKISGNVIGNGKQINLENVELENLIIKDSSNLEGEQPTILSKIFFSKGSPDEFVLKSGNTINGNVTFLSENGRLIVEEDAEFNGEVIGGKLIQK